MEHADVLIVGGGPAGSACARRLVASGRDVVVLDEASFPRDKPCAGWLTPEALLCSGLDPDEYAARHTLQPISCFRVGRIGGRARDVDYGRVVSYAIRRSEFDAELLRRSGARARTGERVRWLRRGAGHWTVEAAWSAPVLVGAGGSRCPVARLLTRSPPPESLVVARQIEYRLDAAEQRACRVRPERPELYFCADLVGYGWCVRKGDFLNVGLGRRDPRELPRHVAAFVRFLVRSGRIASPPGTGWRGHAYRVRHGARATLCADGVLLVGDAAGLAGPESGEGILPALLSGQLAAQVLLEGDGLAPYAARLDECLGHATRRQHGPRRGGAMVARILLAWPWFLRHVLLDRWFLHRNRREARGLSLDATRRLAA